jgi:hypothetical protein
MHVHCALIRALQVRSDRWRLNFPIDASEFFHNIYSPSNSLPLVYHVTVTSGTANGSHRKFTESPMVAFTLAGPVLLASNSGATVNNKHHSSVPQNKINCNKIAEMHALR